MLTIDQKITEAAELYKSGQVASKPQLAKVKRLIRIKVQSAELALQLAKAEDAVPSCP